MPYASALPQFPAGDLTAERIIPRAPVARRPGAPVAPAASGAHRRRSALRPVRGSAPVSASDPARGPRPLRRWSVAELIARANGAPRATA